MSDIRLEHSFRDHPKRVKLQRRLGAEGVLAFVDLLLAVGEHKSSGDLSGWTEEDLAIVSGYPGDIHIFIETLVELQFLDRDNGAFKIHQWAEHNPWAAGAEGRRKAALKAARARWDKRSNPIQLNEDAEKCASNRSAMPSAQKGNAPLLSLPYQDPSFVKGESVDDCSKGGPDSCPHQQIIDLYHEILPALPRVKAWTLKRKKLLRARWREDAKRRNLSSLNPYSTIGTGEAQEN